MLHLRLGLINWLLSYWLSFSLPVTILRPFNTYGPRQSARAVIPQIITQIINKGGKIKLGALSPTRDFNYVEDTCEAFISVANSSMTIGEVLNSASNFEISIGNTAKLIAELLDSKIEIEHEQKRIRPINSEVKRLYGCNRKIKKLTNWGLLIKI